MEFTTRDPTPSSFGPYSGGWKKISKGLGRDSNDLSSGGGQDLLHRNCFDQDYEKVFPGLPTIKYVHREQLKFKKKNNNKMAILDKGKKNVTGFNNVTGTSITNMVIWGNWADSHIGTGIRIRI